MAVQQSYASRTVLNLAQIFLVIVSIGAFLASTTYWVNGLTQRGYGVPVHVSYGGESNYSLGSRAHGVDVELSLPSYLGVEGQPVTRLTVSDQSVILRAWDSTYLEWMLARGDILVIGIAIGIGALLARKVIADIGRGTPFVPGNSRRVLGIAACIAAAVIGSAVLQSLSSYLVLMRLDLEADNSTLSTYQFIDMPALCIAVLVLAIAEAFRHGERLAKDSEGLV